MGMVNGSQMFKDKFGSSRSTSSAEYNKTSMWGWIHLQVPTDHSVQCKNIVMSCDCQMFQISESWFCSSGKKGLLCNSSRNKKKKMK